MFPYKAAIKFTVEHVNKRIPVYVGAGSNSTNTMLTYCKKYEAMGYTWQDIDTYCRSVAVKSQSIRDSWNETEDAANAFAELLKSLIDDRISLIQDLFGAATDELNKVFDTFDSKITDLDNQNDLFGTTSESLEEKYLTLVTATTVLKQTIQSLEDNRGSIIERIQKDYPEYIEMINGIAVVNKQAIEESNNLSDEQKAELLQLYGILEAADGQITEMNDKLIDYFSNMMEHIFCCCNRCRLQWNEPKTYSLLRRGTQLRTGRRAANAAERL